MWRHLLLSCALLLSACSHESARPKPTAGVAPDDNRATSPASQSPAAAPSTPPLVAEDPSSGPPLPFEDAGACPFEGCTYREWTANTRVVVLKDRRDDAPVAFELSAGAPVTALTGVVITVIPGLAQFSDATDVDTDDGTVRMLPGETAYLLTNQGEGYTKAWLHGRLYKDVDITALKPKRAATAVWWVQVRNAKGQVGWTRRPDAFDGKDALG